ncbi:MAG: hypothetical protein AB9856_00190 [Cellulosilyticaceae bacterium]
MKYGNMASAKQYAKDEKQHEWLQLFLRNDGKNLAFAEGLLLEKRYYIGPIKINLDMLNLKAGIPEYLTREDEIKFFYEIVSNMKIAYKDSWDVPPLIVNYSEGTYEVNDGKHRFEMYHQLKVKEVEVLFWITNEEDYYILQKKLEAVI